MAKKEPDNEMERSFCLILNAVIGVPELDLQWARLASEDEFFTNVRRLGVGIFCNLVRDMEEEPCKLTFQPRKVNEHQMNTE